MTLAQRACIKGGATRKCLVRSVELVCRCACKQEGERERETEAKRGDRANLVRLRLMDSEGDFNSGKHRPVVFR